MAMYYFHVICDGTRYPDQEGSDLPDPETARRQAIVAAEQIAADARARGRDDLDSSFEVAGADGRVLFVVPFPRIESLVLN